MNQEDEVQDGAPLAPFSTKGSISGATGTDVNAEAKDFADAPGIGEPSELVRACQAGDLDRIKHLFASKEASALDVEPDGTTALHWAAINNRLSICRYLIESGAIVDARGGDLAATPLHWASKYGLVYIAHLLIQNGADPLRSDNQGFNVLHLAVHSSNVLLVIYLIHQEIPIDTPDPSGRTALHWAAYQGDSLTVDALLKWGADVKVVDSLGFIPLHWAIVKGSRVSIKRLLEEGSDIHAASNDGKTAEVMATEMNTLSLWHGALADVGRNPDGSLRPVYLPKKYTDYTIFLSPFFVLPAIFYLFAILEWYISLPIIFGLFFLYMRLLSWFVIPNAYFGSHVILQTPLYAGIFFCSDVWVWLRYLGYILPVSISSAPFLNLLFISIFALTTASFLVCMLMDPGFVPKLSGITEQREVIEELIDLGEYDSSHFCLASYIRKPLRSKYDRKSKRVVAKFDHVCPWVNNIVGARNHRYFVIFILGLLFGIPLLEYIYYGHTVPQLLSLAEQSSLKECEVLPSNLCGAFQLAPLTTSLSLWCALQCVWVILLVFSQLILIAKGQTTNESINLSRYGALGAEGFSSLPQDHQANHRLMLEKLAAANPVGERKCWTPFSRLIGLDLFLSTASSAIHRQRNKASNPANYGVYRNCVDFWAPAGSFNLLNPPKGTAGSLGGQPIDYGKLWEFPRKSRDYEMHSQA